MAIDEKIDKAIEGIREGKASFGLALQTLNEIKNGMRADHQKRVDEAYQRGYQHAKNECEDCTKNVDLNAIRKEAYEQGRKDGKIEGQAEMWLATKTIYGNPADCAMTNAEVKEIFGDDYELYSIPHIFSAAEAIDRIRAWERKPKPDPYEDCIRGYIYDLCDRHDLRIDQLANVVNRMRRNDA